VTESQAARPTNRLAQETSAYLRQHMHNPVDWRPWGTEALEFASAEDRPLLVSVGYSACHWCHVMEHESFEDPDTAALMNRLFVCIKVDREERPDVDQIYMDAVMGLTGHGGWPLTVFCTPEGRAFHGGTYYPPEPRHGMPSFRQVLSSVARAYAEKRGEIDASAQRIHEALDAAPRRDTADSPGVECARRSALGWLQRADSDNGGFGTAPKFPTPPALDLLLGAAEVLPAPKAREALEHVTHTCLAMARGGLFDQVGGGFHRYSVDAGWRIPHFEKMLYDQGQLLRTYAETWRRGGCEEAGLVWPIRETVAFLRRELQAPDGGFFASLDADSEGHEGRFYVFTPQQIQAVLGDAAGERFGQAYGVSAEGNFEGATTHLRDVAGAARDAFRDERELMRDFRESRVRPGTDRKRLCAWNALTISGLARAGSLLGDASMLDDATRAADFLLATLRDEAGRLLRVWDGERAHVLGFLDDHATLLEACLDLYRAGGEARFLAAAAHCAEQILERFLDEGTGDLFFSPHDGDALSRRPRSDSDGATPHSAGLATLGLLRAANLMGRDAWRAAAEGSLERNAYALDNAPDSHPTLARAALLAQRGACVALIVGEAADPRRQALAAAARRRLAPEDAVIVTSPGSAPAGLDPLWLEGRGPLEGRPAAYLCRGRECSLPVTDIEALLELAVPEAATSP